MKFRPDAELTSSFLGPSTGGKLPHSKPRVVGVRLGKFSGYTEGGGWLDLVGVDLIEHKKAKEVRRERMEE